MVAKWRNLKTSLYFELLEHLHDEEMKLKKRLLYLGCDLSNDCWRFWFKFFLSSQTSSSPLTSNGRRSGAEEEIGASRDRRWRRWRSILIHLRFLKLECGLQIFQLSFGSFFLGSQLVDSLQAFFQRLFLFWDDSQQAVVLGSALEQLLLHLVEELNLEQHFL